VNYAYKARFDVAWALRDNVENQVAESQNSDEMAENVGIHLADPHRVLEGGFLRKARRQLS
jgi:hypothetical protein